MGRSYQILRQSLSKLRPELLLLLLVLRIRVADLLWDKWPCLHMSPFRLQHDAMP